VWHSRRDSDAIPSPFTSPRVENLHAKRVAARRVEEIALVAVPSDDAETYEPRHTLAVNTLALLSRDDLVDLAWSWLARATQCASGLRTELVSKCDVGKEGATFFSNENAKGLTVDALVNGCCAAVASYADAGCGCALEVAEGLAPFLFGRRASSPGESAMARNDDAHAAAATLEALCFGEKDAEQKTSCVSSSATLAATRAVALENVQEEEPKSKARTRAFSSSSSPGTGTSQGSSPEEREYVAFKRWLDGADATPLSSTVVDADPDDVVTFGGGGETDAGRSESNAQENANASRTKSPNGRRDEDEDEDEDEKKNASWRPSWRRRRSRFFFGVASSREVAGATICFSRARTRPTTPPSRSRTGTRCAWWRGGAPTWGRAEREIHEVQFNMVDACAFLGYRRTHLSIGPALGSGAMLLRSAISGYFTGMQGTF
jgi:hypothetical protein